MANILQVEFEAKDFAAAAKQYGAAADQLPFIMSLSLNRAVRDTRGYLVEHTWPQSIVERNPSFIRATLGTDFSSKHDLEVSIFDRLGHVNLEALASGGTKTGRGGNLAIPTKAIRRGAHGVAKSQKPRNLARSFKLNNKIFQQVGRGKSAQIKVMYFLKPSVNIPKKVPFYEDFTSQMEANLNNELPGAVERAMATRIVR